MVRKVLVPNSSSLNDKLSTAVLSFSQLYRVKDNNWQSQEKIFCEGNNSLAVIPFFFVLTPGIFPDLFGRNRSC